MMVNQGGEFKKIAVIEDNSDLFRGVIKNTKEAEFVYLENVKVEDLQKTFESAGYYGILYISPELINVPNAVQLISKQQPPIGLLQYIENSLKKEIERQKLLAYKIENLDEIMKNIETSVSVQTKKIDETGASQRDEHRYSNGTCLFVWIPDVYARFYLRSTGYEGSNRGKNQQGCRSYHLIGKTRTTDDGENYWHSTRRPYSVLYLDLSYNMHRHGS